MIWVVQGRALQIGTRFTILLRQNRGQASGVLTSVVHLQLIVPEELGKHHLGRLRPDLRAGVPQSYTQRRPETPPRMPDLTCSWP